MAAPANRNKFPVIECLSSTSPAQSVSEYSWRLVHIVLHRGEGYNNGHQHRIIIIVTTSPDSPAEDTQMCLIRDACGHEVPCSNTWRPALSHR